MHILLKNQENAMVADAVAIEPVSLKNSLISGNLQGNFRNLQRMRARLAEK